MKTVKEIRAAVAAGMTSIGSITVSHNGSGDIDFKHNGILFAWIHESDADEKNAGSACSFTNVPNNIAAVVALCDWLGYELVVGATDVPKDAAPQKSAREVLLEQELEKHRIKIAEARGAQDHAAGMVEAYEKIIIGRTLQVGK